MKVRVYYAIWGLFLAGAGAACAWYYSILLASDLSSFVLSNAQSGLDFSLFMVVLGISAVACVVIFGSYIDRRFPPGSAGVLSNPSIALYVVMPALFICMSVFQFYNFVFAPYPSRPLYIAQGIWWFFLGILPLLSGLRKRRAWRRVQSRLAAELADAQQQFASNPSVRVKQWRPGLIEVYIDVFEFSLFVLDNYPLSPPFVDCCSPALWEGRVSPLSQGVQHEMPQGEGLQLAIDAPTSESQERVPCTLSGWHPDRTITDIVDAIARLTRKFPAAE